MTLTRQHVRSMVDQVGGYIPADLIVQGVTRLALQGESIPAIAARMRLTRSEVWHIIHDELRDHPDMLADTVTRRSLTMTPWALQRAITLWEQGKTQRDIANELGVHRELILKYFQRAEVPPRPLFWTEERLSYLLRVQHLPVREIAEYLGCSPMHVSNGYKLLREQGRMERKPTAKRKQRGWSKETIAKWNADHERKDRQRQVFLERMERLGRRIGDEAQGDQGINDRVKGSIPRF